MDKALWREGTWNTGALAVSSWALQGARVPQHTGGEQHCYKQNCTEHACARLRKHSWGTRCLPASSLTSLHHQ